MKQKITSNRVFFYLDLKFRTMHERVYIEIMDHITSPNKSSVFF